MPEGFSLAQETARRASVAVFVTCHYRPEKMQFLNRVLSNLSAFNVGRMRVTLVTSADDPASMTRLSGLCRNYFPHGDYEIDCFPDQDPPTMLTWKHKPLLRDAVQAGHSHCIYLEDDIDLTFVNFLYFLHYVDALRELGLVPALLRTEFNDATGEIRSTDALRSTYVANTPLLNVLGQTFACPEFPYCASYILDRALADEYLASRSFDCERSREVCGWGIPERAAMGLCWENPPQGYRHRYVLPVSASLVPMPFCQTAHMPSNYTNAETVFGRVPINGLFTAT
jgi:hypothetical protein